MSVTPTVAAAADPCSSPWPGSPRSPSRPRSWSGARSDRST